MQKLKEKKQHKDEVKEKRKAVQEAAAAQGSAIPGLGEDSDDDNEIGDTDPSSNTIRNAEMLFQDDQTKDMFGDSVTVVVDTAGLATELESHLYPVGDALPGQHNDHHAKNKSEQGGKQNKKQFVNNNKKFGHKPHSKGGDELKSGHKGGNLSHIKDKGHKKPHKPAGGKMNPKMLLEKAMQKKKK